MTATHDLQILRDNQTRTGYVALCSCGWWRREIGPTAGFTAAALAERHEHGDALPSQDGEPPVW